jgi:hypothetical protein
MAVRGSVPPTAAHCSAYSTVRMAVCAHYYVHCHTLPYTAATMCEASCGSMIPPIIYYLLFIIISYLFIHYSVSAAAACVKHPAGYANIVALFIYYSLFSACSGSMLQASYGSMIPPIIYYSLSINFSFSACSGSMCQSSCGLYQHHLLFIIYHYL